ncbi:formin protein cappuccino isoform X2 [Musca autumnalis]|uniref:formin protein cappuccino isoform X2 n=1 Tax=Musca autumnalis TaxID=221902 RepID=UPI003CED60AA
MGNSQMKTAADAPLGDAGGGVEVGGGGGMSSSSLRSSVKSRRGSRVKVFGLLGQKKASKEPTTPTTPSSATAPPQFGVANVAKSRTSTASCIEMIDEEERASMEQSHAAVIRQLELEQMEMRSKPKKTKSNKFSWQSGKSNPTTNDTQKVSSLKKKRRLAPQPPCETSKPLAKTTTNELKSSTVKPNIGEKVVPSKDELQNEQQHLETKNNSDHREFIEKLFVDTLQNTQFDVTERVDDAEIRQAKQTCPTAAMGTTNSPNPPLSPHSASIVTAPLAGSPGDPCPTSTATYNDDEFLDGDEDDDVDSSATATSTTTKQTNKNLTHNKSLTYTAVQLPTALEQNLLAAAAASTNATQAKKQRPLSEISIASGDTSGILSPTTARAIYELRRRHQADKLSLLSVAKTSYLEIVPTELPTESSPESTDEQMAMHLGKKLAQVLSGNSAGAGGATNSAGVGTGVNTNSAGTPGSPLPDNGNYFIAATTPTTTATNELFNIAKAKKIELPSLSSRLVASAAPSLDSYHAHTHSTASTDAKHLPTLQSSSSTPSLSSLHSNITHTAGTPTHSTETQSTVIISFKSSQTPVLSQTIIPGANAPPTPPDETFSHELPTPLNNNDNAEPTMPSTMVSLSSSIIGATSQMGSPLPPCTPRNNVLKKVASFTAEKAAAGSASKINNGDSCCGMAGPYESNGLRRSSFVPEKLSFAAYEKFEGQMLMKWFVSSLQNNGNGHLSEQDINTLTLQYCNNLINVGVLKQISERRDADLDAFSPFHMYQWTHTEAPTTSQPHTPGKLDKVNIWPYCSTPAGIPRLPKSIQVETPQPERETGFQQLLRKKLLSCSTIAEVHAVVNDLLTAGEPLRKPSKRCIQLTELLNASETTVYQYDKNDKNVSDGSSGIEIGSLQEVGVQTEDEALQGQTEFVCSKCKNSSKEEISTCEKEVQVSLVEMTESEKLNSKTESSSSTPTSKPPPPPPPPPANPLSPSAPTPPPPPPPPATNLPPPPPPPPLPSGPGGLPPPPPPPAPPCLNSTIPNSINHNTSAGGTPPPPPPGQPKTPSTPAPLPNPTEGGWFNQTNTLRKTAVNPPKPMKPLYWTRIVTQPPPPPKPAQPFTDIISDETDSSPSTSPDDPPPVTKPQATKEIWQEIDETSLDNIDEFTELFSREAVVPVSKPKVKTEVRVRHTKVLDSKRSQNVGIISRSSHVDFCEIEHAIYHVDTSVVSLETLQQIINIKATNEELELIKEAAQSDIPLDYPEQFLLKISQISMSTERISCIVFMADFEECATVIERKLEVVMHLSQFLMESEELKLLFAIILTLGNYMNGGNRQRGQADGFTLEILGKLKDVKSKESHTTLLHFIVRTYISRKRKEGVQLLEIPLPIPEPSDVERASQVDFDEVKRQITELNRQLKSTKAITEKVISNSTPQNMEPFKSKMEEFIEHATKVVDKLYKELDDCRDTFLETMKFYHYAPKTGTIESCTPKTFFENWTNFTNDFKDIMKKEIAILWNELLKKSKDVQSRKTVKTTKVKPGGLKERILRLNKK